MFWRHWTLAVIAANGVPTLPIFFSAQSHLLLPSKNLTGARQISDALSLCSRASAAVFWKDKIISIIGI
jgi:hypothetical protein